MKPSRGEKPPFMTSSRSHSWRSVRRRSTSCSDSARSCWRRGASRACRSLRTLPWGALACRQRAPVSGARCRGTLAAGSRRRASPAAEAGRRGRGCTSGCPGEEIKLTMIAVEVCLVDKVLRRARGRARKLDEVNSSTQRPSLGSRSRPRPLLALQSGLAVPSHPFPTCYRAHRARSAYPLSSIRSFSPRPIDRGRAWRAFS